MRPRLLHHEVDLEQLVRQLHLHHIPVRRPAARQDLARRRHVELIQRLPTVGAHLDLRLVRRGGGAAWEAGWAFGRVEGKTRLLTERGAVWKGKWRAVWKASC
eukprot:364286-Chlamydomonas_euryale.AAC.1